MAGGGNSRSQEAFQVCCDFNTGSGALVTGKQDDCNAEDDNPSGRMQPVCTRQFSDSGASPLLAQHSQHGVELLLARSCGPECGASEPTRRAAGTQPAGRCGRRRLGWILSMKGLRGGCPSRMAMGLIRSCSSVHKNCHGIFPGHLCSRESHCHRCIDSRGCGVVRGRGVGPARSEDCRDGMLVIPPLTFSTTPPALSPPINGFEESRLGCDMGSLESSCFFELCVVVHVKAHAQASEDRRMACKLCDLLRPERLSQKQVQRRRKEADASSTLRSRCPQRCSAYDASQGGAKLGALTFERDPERQKSCWRCLTGPWV